MKCKFASLIAALFVFSSAHAADLSLKAPVYVPTPCEPQNCSGWYAGFGLLGDGNNADIIGGGLNNSLFQAGGAIMVAGGYQLWNGAWFAAFELGGGYEFTNINASTLTQHGSKFTGTELVKLGYNFFPVAQSKTTAPSQSPIPLTVPANLLASTTPYLVFGGLQRRGISGWANGVGVETIVAAAWSSALEYLYMSSQQGVPATNIVTLKLLRHF